MTGGAKEKPRVAKNIHGRMTTMHLPGEATRLKTWERMHPPKTVAAFVCAFCEPNAEKHGPLLLGAVWRSGFCDCIIILRSFLSLL